MADRPDERRERERRETDWLYNEIQQMRQEHRDAHQRLRHDMHMEFDRFRTDVIVKHANTLDDLSARVLVMETERDMDAKHAAKVGVRWGVGGAAAIAALVEFFRKQLGG